MKVAVCTWSFVEYASSLARALPCDVEVIAPAYLSEGYSVSTFPYHLKDRTFQKLKACRQVAAMLRKFNPDVIHFLDSSPLITPFLPGLKCPIVFSWHDPVEHSGEENLPLRVSQRLMIRAARRVIVLSQAMLETAARINRTSADKLRLIPHPVYEVPPGPEAKPAGIAEEFTLFFGRVSPYKGVEDLCAAFLRDPRGQLVIAGEQLYPANIPNHPAILILNERVPLDTMRYLFRHAKLIVLPYKDATQSGVLMLAYTFGTPVLATRTSGIAEYITDDTAITVAPNDPDALAMALSKALRSDLGPIGKRGQEYASAQYGWGATAAAHMTVYLEAEAHKIRQADANAL